MFQAVARHSVTHSGLPVDWQTQTLITVGATEALASAFMGLLNRGDEVWSPNIDVFSLSSALMLMHIDR